jgi:hypothetical protein
MARISGVDLPREKRVEIALTYIYGIGLHTSQQVLEQTGISPDTRVRDLTDDETNRLREVIDRDIRVEGDEHQAADGYRVLPWDAPSSWSSAPWPAHAHERANAPWSEAGDWWTQEVVMQVNVGWRWAVSYQ